MPVGAGVQPLPARSGNAGTEARFRSTFDQVAVGIAHTTIEGRILEVNRRLCEMLGYSATELLALTTRDLTHPDDRDRLDDLRLELIAGKRKQFSGDKRYLRKDGSVFWVNRTVTLARETPDGEPYLIQTIDSIDKRKLAEGLLARANRAHRVLAACSHILVHATDETEMLKDMCHVVVESGGYKMAWVGLATSDPMRPVYPAAHAGFEGDVPMTGAAAWSPDGRYRGFMSEVMASGEPHIARNILQDPAHTGRYARALQRGFQSSIALPLKGDGRIIGAIAIYAAEADAFDVEEIGLLKQLADDIAYGINNLRTRIAREQAEKVAQEHERRLKWTLEQAAVGITRVGFDGLVLDVNQKFCDLLGYAKDEVVGQTIGKFTYPGDNEQDAQDRTQLLRGEAKSLVTEKRFLRKDDSIVWARRTISAAYDDAGTPQYIIGVIEDITERKELERRYERVFDQAAVGITRVDLEGILVDANQKFCDMLGYTKDELLGKTVKNVTHPDDYGSGAQYRAQLTHDTAKPMVGEKRFVRKNGTSIWTRRTMSTALDDAGNPLYLISVIEDITERKGAEDTLRATFDQANVGIAITSPETGMRFLQVNDKFCQILGYSRDEFMKMGVQDTQLPGGFEATLEVCRKLVTGEITGALREKQLKRKDGVPVWTSLSTSLVREPDGAPRYFVTLMQDISERKVLEIQFSDTFEQAAVGIFHADLDGRYLRVNRKFCEITGYTEEEMTGPSRPGLSYPEDFDSGSVERKRLLSGAIASHSNEKRYIRKDGKVIWVNRTESLARDASGKPMYFIRVIEDITERREMEERYRATFNNAPVGIMHTAIDSYKILHVNPKLCEMLGYMQDELLTMTSTDVVHPDHRFTDASKYKAPILKDEARSFASERKFVRKDGSSLWVNRTVSLARNAAGEPLYFIRVIEDITERKQAEEMIARERALLRTIIDALPDYIYVKDRAGPFLLANKAWLAARGEQDEDIAGKTVLDYFPRELAERLAAQDLGIVKTGIPLLDVEQKLIVKGRDGGQSEERWASTSKVPMRTATGDIIGTVGISRDITELKQSVARRAMEHAVTRVLAESPTLAGAMPKVIRTMCEAMGWAYGARWAWDEGEQMLCRTEYWCEFEPEFDPADREHWLKVANTGSGRLLRRAWIDKKATWLANLHDDKPFRRRASAVKLGWHSAYAFPILIGKDVIGVMEFFGPNRREPDEALLQVTGSIGSQIGQFVQRKEAERALRTSEERYRDLFELSPLPMWVWDDETRAFLSVNEAAVNHYGYTQDEFLRMNVRDIWAPGNETQYEESLRDRSREQTLHLQRKHRTKDGRVIDVDVTARRFMVSGRPVWLTLVNDITDRKRAEEQLLHLAHYDVLTNLPNRVLFYDRLKQVLAQAKRNQWITGVMFMDVDRFKNINDTLGHAVGDLLLQQVSERLVSSVRSEDTVGRLGGDEFAIVLSNLTSAQDASFVAQKIMANFNEPFKLEGADIYVTASIGITLYPEDSTEQDALIKNADAAMYKAKEAGRNSFRFYTPEMNARGLALLNLEGSLRRALERDEFLLHFQPKANIASGEITGFEALLRWRHPERGLVSPAEFIPVMEETGLIVPAGAWVLNAVCKQIKQWEQAGVRSMPVAVNLSARQFLMRDLGPTIKGILEENQVDPRLIELEITESSLMVNPEEAARTLGFLKALGVKLSIDDFGTGYSSLSYLKRFPLDALKVDGSFVRDITTNPDDATITRAVISMAHSLGLKVIAEGVETEPQLAFLAEHGCNEIQGYFFARPMPAEECAAWLTQGRSLKRLAQPA